MSHFLTLVFMKEEVELRTIPKEVDRVMGLYASNLTMSDASSTYWDSWQIGGRYDGAITQAKTVDDTTKVTLDSQIAFLIRNLCPVRDLPVDLIPFAVVAPDGRCYLEGRMEEFGYSYDHDPYWEDKYDVLRAQYADCLAVGLDCHI